MTGPDGTFRISAGDVEAAQAGTDFMSVRIGDPTGEGTATLRVSAKPGDHLEDLRLWDPAITTTPFGAYRLIKWIAPARPRVPTRLEGTIFDGVPDDRQAVLRTTVGAGESAVLQFDPRELEDRAGMLLVSATDDEYIANGVPAHEWTSAPQPVPGSGRPTSRGATCTTDPPTTGPCPLTDGDLLTKPSSRAHFGVVDLGRLVPTHYISVRSTDDDVALGVSLDGKEFASVGLAGGLKQSTLFSADLHGERIRYIRAGAGRDAVLTEVSAWEGPPARAATTTGGRRASRGTAFLTIALLVVFTAPLVLALRRSRRKNLDA
jgi:hypothetical protein